MRFTFADNAPVSTRSATAKTRGGARARPPAPKRARMGPVAARGLGTQAPG